MVGNLLNSTTDHCSLHTLYPETKWTKPVNKEGGSMSRGFTPKSDINVPDTY